MDIDFTQDDLDLIYDALELMRAKFDPNSPLKIDNGDTDACKKIDTVLIKIKSNYIPMN